MQKKNPQNKIAGNFHFKNKTGFSLLRSPPGDFWVEVSRAWQRWGSPSVSTGLAGNGSARATTSETGEGLGQLLPLASLPNNEVISLLNPVWIWPTSSNFPKLSHSLLIGPGKFKFDYKHDYDPQGPVSSVPRLPPSCGLSSLPTPLQLPWPP